MNKEKEQLYQRVKNYLEIVISDACEMETERQNKTCKDDVYYEFHIFEDMKNVIMLIDTKNYRLMRRIVYRVCRNINKLGGLDIVIYSTKNREGTSYEGPVKLFLYGTKNNRIDLNRSIAYWGEYKGRSLYLNCTINYEYCEDYLNPVYREKGEMYGSKHVENIEKAGFTISAVRWDDYVKWYEEFYDRKLYTIDHIERRQLE